MPAHWVIQNNTLMIQIENDAVCIPTSQYIFAEVFNSEKPKNIQIPDVLEKPQYVFPDLKFSKIGSKLKVRILINNQKITGEVYISRHGQDITLDRPYVGGPDHIIINGQWIYLSENYNEVAELLKIAEIEDLVNISFSSYLNLQNKLSLYPTVFVEDLVKGNLKVIAENITAELPNGLNATLYPYQSTGYKWLKFITDENCGCILGDEMGLGKTLQAIALILNRKQYGGGPSLVIAPVTILENWKREIAKFAPELLVLVNHGSDRTGRFTELQKFDVVVISYNSAISDLSMLHMVKWDLLILDEAQNIKNPNATRTKLVKRIPRRAGIAITGTPFENHMSDIWSVVDFVMPEFLGTFNVFQCNFSDDITGAEKIEPILSSLMIRRRVAEVAKDLPEKVIIPQPLIMSDIEAFQYEDERQKIINKSNTKSASLSLLIKLRMFSTHPYLTDNSILRTDPMKVSIKYSRLCEILEEIIECKEKAILFTSFTEMFSILQDDIPARFNVPVLSINGNTPVTERQQIVDNYSSIEGAALLVLNPRAAGIGLNITSANHVIHYNLEWNPAVEDQATARAFRRGQKKTVFVYRLYYIDTVEQFVNDKIEMKRDISNIAVIGTSGEIDNRSDILAALMKSPVHKEVVKHV